MDTLHYLITGAFGILLIMYILKTRIDNQFRKKMVPLLKKQKANIKTLEEERERLAEKNKDLIRDLNIANNTISKTQDEYDKIHYILDAGISQPAHNFHDSLIKRKLTAIKKNELERESATLEEQISNITKWFGLIYDQLEPAYEDLEITNALQKYSDMLNAEFDSKRLNFVTHLGEPVTVHAEESLLKYIMLTFGRLIGKRAESGKSIYIDLEKTGKKCLISLEDTGPGPDDVEIKSLFKEIWSPSKLPDLKDEQIIPVLLAKDFVSIQQGNTWYSKVQEIGMKITFSIPLTK